MMACTVRFICSHVLDEVDPGCVSVSLRVGSVLALQVLVKAVKALWECPDVTVRVWREFHSPCVDIFSNILYDTESSDKHF